jgi:hypothetical protein
MHFLGCSIVEWVSATRHCTAHKSREKMQGQDCIAYKRFVHLEQFVNLWTQFQNIHLNEDVEDDIT